MSKICGIWHFDSRPASRKEEAWVWSALAVPGYFAPQIEWGPGMVLGCAAGTDHPVVESMHRAPGRHGCLWDGRLDNAADLCRQTGLPANASEAAIAIDLYRRKGADGLGELLGDWSLAIWDVTRREIVLASDFAGVRPLYYHRDSTGVSWSSSLANLVAATGITDLDDSYIATFLTGSGNRTHTPYDGIFAVAAGHAIAIGPDGIREQRFWNLPVDREIHYADDREYAENLLSLFREAVQVRLAHGRRACAELSGGLDSSSIVCMADRLRRDVPDQIPPFTTFSYTHPNSIDERFFREVERVCNLTPCHLPLSEGDALSAGLAAALPGWWEARYRELARQMAAFGAGILLTGQLGDLIMGNTPDDSSQVAEYLAGVHIGSAAREAYAWAKSMQVPVYPILWRGIREAWFSWAPSIDPRSAVGAVRSSAQDSLTTQFRTRAEELRLPERPWSDIPPGRRTRYRAAEEMLQSRRLATPEALQHLSFTHPYTHRPMVEFMLTIPPRVAFGPDQPRRLMRRAFQGLLPQLVLNRKSKGDYGSVYRQSSVPLAAALLRNSEGIQLVKRGYLDRQSLLDRLDRYGKGLDCNETQLQAIVILEFWLRNRMGNSAPQVPAEKAFTAPQA